MDWQDEPFIKVYTRDTGAWLALGWEAQSLFLLTMRKVDRAGLLPLGHLGLAGLGKLLAVPDEVIERAMAVLLKDGCVEVNDENVLIVVNFIEAQCARQSDAARKRRSRENRRAISRNGHQRSQGVTTCHTYLGVTASGLLTTSPKSSLPPDPESTSATSESIAKVEPTGVELWAGLPNGQERVVNAVPAKGSDSPVARVFGVYQGYHPRAKLGPKEKALLARALKTHSEAECVAAIHGNHMSDWHNGLNEQRKTYHALGLILRDGDHITQFIEEYERSRKGAAPALSEREMRGALATEAFIRGDEG